MCDSILKTDENVSSQDKSTIITDANNNKNELNEELNESYESSNYNREDNLDNEDNRKVSFIGYNLEEEQDIENAQNEYHTLKQSGDWYYAKLIVSHAYQDKGNTDFFCEHLEKQFQKNADSFDNVIVAYYKNDLDIDIIYEFSKEPAKHLIDNLRIPAYKPHGIIFSNSEDANKWSFRIVVITTKGIYTANRYITEDLIGCY